MKPTPEQRKQQKELRAAYEAAGSVWPMQFRGWGKSKWQDVACSTPAWFRGKEYRRKPEPETEESEMKAEDVINVLGFQAIHSIREYYENPLIEKACSLREDRDELRSELAASRQQADDIELSLREQLATAIKQVAKLTRERDTLEMERDALRSELIAGDHLEDDSERSLREELAERNATKQQPTQPAPAMTLAEAWKVLRDFDATLEDEPSDEFDNAIDICSDTAMDSSDALVRAAWNVWMGSGVNEPTEIVSTHILDKFFAEPEPDMVQDAIDVANALLDELKPPKPAVPERWFVAVHDADPGYEWRRTAHAVRFMSGPLPDNWHWHEIIPLDLAEKTRELLGLHNQYGVPEGGMTFRVAGLIADLKKGWA